MPPAPVDATIPGRPSLHLRRWGVEGEPVLLLHGLGGNTYWWEDVAPRLGPGFQLAALDLRGHGDSGWVEGGVYELDGFIEDIERARRHLGWDRFHLAAHSMGARVSLSYARRHPELLKKLAAIDFLPEFSPGMIRKYKLAFKMAQPVYPTLAAILPRFRLEPPETVLSRDELERFARHCVRESKGGFAWKFDWNLFHIRYPSAWNELPQIRVPAMIVYGEKSRIMTAEDCRKVVEKIPGARGAGIAGAFHHVPLDAPEELAKVLREFLSAVR